MAVAVLLLALIASSTLHATIAKRIDHRGLAEGGPATPGVYDITQFGVKAKDKVTGDEQNSVNSLSFIKAWQAACHSPVPEAKLVIPPGIFEVGPVVFAGPCNATVTVDIQGTLKSNREGTLYFDSYWLVFENVTELVVTGKGTVDGDAVSTYKNCATKPDCGGHPNIKFMNVTNALIDGVISVNPMFAHVYVGYSNNVVVRNMKMTAPENSVRTDGVFVTQSKLVNIANNTIATGTDCVAIAGGSKEITITDLTCGPGNGVSIGSLYSLSNIGTNINNSLDVEDVVVKTSTFSKTTSGLTIKTLLGNPGNKVTGITFEDLEMDHVKNPIIILQEDKKNPSPNNLATAAAPAKISDIHYKNIKGTSTSPAKDFVSFSCSPLMPCEGIEIADVKLVSDDTIAAATAAATGTVFTVPSGGGCLNAKVTFKGSHDGINC